MKQVLAALTLILAVASTAKADELVSSHISVGYSQIEMKQGYMEAHTNPCMAEFGSIGLNEEEATVALTIGNGKMTKNGRALTFDDSIQCGRPQNFNNVSGNLNLGRSIIRFGTPDQAKLFGKLVKQGASIEISDNINSPLTEVINTDGSKSTIPTYSQSQIRITLPGKQTSVALNDYFSEKGYVAHSIESAIVGFSNFGRAPAEDARGRQLTSKASKSALIETAQVAAPPLPGMHADTAVQQ